MAKENDDESGKCFVQVIKRAAIAPF